jgi:hypothetical protein
MASPRLDVTLCAASRPGDQWQKQGVSLQAKGAAELGSEQGLKVRQTNVTPLSNKDNRKDTKMSFAIGRTQAIGWKRFKVGYVAAAAALALAVTAAVGIAFTNGGSGPSSPSSIAPPAPQASVNPPPTYIYVVSSHEQAIAVERAFNEADGERNFLYEVLVVDTPEGEARLRLALKELTDAGLSGYSPGLVIVDRRYR